MKFFDVQGEEHVGEAVKEDIEMNEMGEMEADNLTRCNP